MFLFQVFMDLAFVMVHLYLPLLLFTFLNSSVNTTLLVTTVNVVPEVTMVMLLRELLMTVNLVHALWQNHQTSKYTIMYQSSVGYLFIAAFIGLNCLQTCRSNICKTGLWFHKKNVKLRFFFNIQFQAMWLVEIWVDEGLRKSQF